MHSLYDELLHLTETMYKYVFIITKGSQEPIDVEYVLRVIFAVSIEI